MSIVLPGLTQHVALQARIVATIARDTASPDIRELADTVALLAMELERVVAEASPVRH